MRGPHLAAHIEPAREVESMSLLAIVFLAAGCFYAGYSKGRRVEAEEQLRRVERMLSLPPEDPDFVDHEPLF